MKAMNAGGRLHGCNRPTIRLLHTIVDYRLNLIYHYIMLINPTARDSTPWPND